MGREDIGSGGHIPANNPILHLCYLVSIVYVSASQKASMLASVISSRNGAIGMKMSSVAMAVWRWRTVILNGKAV